MGGRMGRMGFLTTAPRRGTLRVEESMHSVAEVASGLVDRSHGALDYILRFFREYSAVIEELCATRALSRLGSVSQIGLKRSVRGVPNMLVPFCGGEMGRTEAVASVTRLEHTHRVCAATLALAALHRLPFEQTLHACVASLFHDAGHPPFSHALESLCERLAIEWHEALGVRLLTEDGEVAGILRRHRVDALRVALIMREEGDDGLRQSLNDSLTYVIHDGPFAGMRTDRDFAWEIYRSILGAEDGAFLVSDPFPLEQFLEMRLSLLDRFHTHAYNRAVDLMTGELCGYLVGTGMEADELCRGTDADVLSALDARAGDVPAWVASARRFVLGRPTEIRRWRVTEHESAASAQERTDAATPERPCFLLPPIDLSGKSFRVCMDGYPAYDIRARPEGRPTHQHRWHALSYAGSV